MYEIIKCLLLVCIMTIIRVCACVRTHTHTHHNNNKTHTHTQQNTHTHLSCPPANSYRLCDDPKDKGTKNITSRLPDHQCTSGLSWNSCTETRITSATTYTSGIVTGPLELPLPWVQDGASVYSNRTVTVLKEWSADLFNTSIIAGLHKFTI